LLHEHRGNFPRNGYCYLQRGLKPGFLAVIVTGSVIGWSWRMSQDQVRSSGRPRRHVTPSARADASRSQRGLKKVTVDVPEKFVTRLQIFARRLRRMPSHKVSTELSLKPVAWLYEPNDKYYHCTYERGVAQNPDGNIDTIHDPTVRLAAYVRPHHHVDRNGHDVTDFTWNVARIARETIGGATALEVEIGHGRCQEAYLAKRYCESLMLTCIIGDSMIQTL